MQAVIEGLGIQRPLQREVLAPAEVVIAVDAPGDGEMVEDHVVDIVRRHRVVALIGRLVLVAQANPQVANDDVGGAVNQERVVLETNAVAGGGLPGNGEVGPFDLQLMLELNRAAHVEHDGPRSAHCAKSLPQRTGSGVVQIRDVIHIAAASAFGEPAKTFGAGKGELLARGGRRRAGWRGRGGCDRCGECEQGGRRREGGAGRAEGVMRGLRRTHRDGHPQSSRGDRGWNTKQCHRHLFN